MARSDRRSKKRKTTPPCSLPEFEQVRKILKRNNISIQDIYTKLEGQCDKVKRPKRNQNVHRFLKTIKKQTFCLNFCRFSYGAYVLRQKENLSWESFVERYWAGVEHIDEVVLEFQKIFDKLSDLGLNATLAPLLNVQAPAQVAQDNLQPLDLALEELDVAEGSEGDIKSNGHTSCFADLVASVDTPSESFAGSFPHQHAPPPPPKKGAPPPPPCKKTPPPTGSPPPPPRGRKKANDGLTRAPEVIAMFQEMRKALLGKAAKGGGGPKKIGGGAVDPGALMNELSKNSKYAAQVQADIENYGDTIQDLITQVSTFEPKDMPEMIEFVGKVGDVLSELFDETAVLKKFDWPQRYYTMLEAKSLYTELETMKETFSPWKKTENKAVAEMEKIQKLMDKSRTRMDVIMMTKDSDEKRFKDDRIPWTAKIFTEVKIASLSPLIAYMEVVLEEVNLLMSAAPAEQGPMRKKALDKSLEHLNGTITLAFKVHQFTGGYTEECNSKFAEVSTKIAEIRGEIAAMAS